MLDEGELDQDRSREKIGEEEGVFEEVAVRNVEDAEEFKTRENRQVLRG